MKREWYKPQLVIIVRNKPEELVLLGCKVDENNTGAANYHTFCIEQDGESDGCSSCMAMLGS